LLYIHEDGKYPTETLTIFNLPYYVDNDD